MTVKRIFICVFISFAPLSMLLQAKITFSELENQLQLTEEPEQAIKILQETAEHLDSWSPTDKGRYYALLAEQLGKVARLDEAFEAYTQAILILETHPASEILIKSYIERSYISYLRTNDAKIYCNDRKKALQYAREFNDSELLARALTQLSFCYESNADFREGLKLLEEALLIAENETLSADQHAMIYNATALLYRENQIHERAYESVAKAYELWKSIGDKQDMHNMLHTMVGEALQMGKWKLANKHVEQLFELAKSSPGYRDFYFFSHYNAGRTYLFQGKFDEAAQQLSTALELKKMTQEQFFVNRVSAMLAIALMRTGKIQKAEKHARDYLNSKPTKQSDKKYIFVSNAILKFAKGDFQGAMSEMFDRIDLESKQRLDFINNETTNSSLEHDINIVTFENQLLQHQLAISNLELDRGKDQQQIANLTIAVIILCMLVLAIATVFLIQSRKTFKIRAQTDFLTGTANRRFALEAGQKALYQANRRSGVLSILLMDIDKFKSINDTYGHDIGDQTIKAAANQASHWLRSPDILSRFGGEEFLILLPNTDHQEALDIAQRIRKGIAEKTFQFGEFSVCFTLSIGVSSSTSSDVSLVKLIHRADSALYQAKGNGRNRVESALLV